MPFWQKIRLPYHDPSNWGTARRRILKSGGQVGRVKFSFLILPPEFFFGFVLFPLTLSERWARNAPALGEGVTISGQVSTLESGRFRSPRAFAFDLLKIP
jgi:hypothetical protein